MIAVALTAGRAALTLLRHPAGQAIVALCLVLAGGWWHGENRYGDGVAAERKVWTDRQAEDERQAAEITNRHAVAAAAIGARVEERQAQARTITNTIIREVPRYVTVQADARCAVPDGFVRLHDAAAAARLPEPPDATGRPDDPAARVALSAVAETVAANYGACNAVIEQVRGWQSWAREVGMVK